LFLLVFFNPSVSHAKSVPHASIEGTVTGTIRVADNRDLRFITNVTGGDPFPAITNVRRVVVAVTAIPVNLGDGPAPINPTFFAVTDDNGNFTSPWQDQTRNAFPARLRITILWQSSDEAGGGTVPPATLFRIARVGVGVDISPQTVFRENVNASGATDLGVLTAAANDETAAYLTTREFFDRIVSNSRVLRNRMPGLVVKTRVLDFDVGSGVTPFPREAYVSDGTPVTSPRVLAHELGHAVTWAALDLNLAPINPATDYSHPLGLPLHWAPDSREFSKAAFLEGLADVWALEWAFGSNLSAVIPRGTRTLSYEVPRIIRADGTVALDCRTVVNAHEFPFCHTAAVRDLLDNRGTDGVDLTQADIINTLDRFQNCLSNGCRDELGLDALNHHDFLCNATPASRRTAIRAVWSGNGISGGPGSFCGQS
jgi:hypothetical protein